MLQLEKNALLFGASDLFCCSEPLRLLVHHPIDKTSGWGNFDGAKEDTQSRCRVGNIVFSNEFHTMRFNTGMGDTTNNYREHLTLEVILKFPTKSGPHKIRAFWDYLVVINWMNETFRIESLVMEPIFEELKIMTMIFNSSLSFM